MGKIQFCDRCKRQDMKYLTMDMRSGAEVCETCLKKLDKLIADWLRNPEPLDG